VIKLVARILVAALVALAYEGSADDKRNLPTIGLAIPVDPATDAPFQGAFREGLRDLGYVDGENVRLIPRYSNGDPVKYRALIQELVGLRVDILWGEAKELQEATTTIPIVSPRMPDPLSSGLVTSLARPGGNLTGVSYQVYDINPKRLELAKELLPSLKRLCYVFDDGTDPGLLSYLDNEVRARARNVGVSICMIPVRTLDDIRAVPKALDRERPQAIVIWNTPFTWQHRDAFIPFVARRVPLIGDGREVIELGAVLSYSVDWVDMFRRSAMYVDKILKGAKPGDLPIEQPTKFKVILNLKAAKALNIKVPESILVRADEIIR
jgi:putative ABC transport system substrate-binding protein